jgi:hypothetical protein
MKKFIFALIFLFYFAIAFAQTTVFPHKLFLKNGTILNCKILNYKPDESIKVEIQGGNILVYSSSEIKEVLLNQNASEQNLKDKKDNFHYYNDELYFNILVNFLGGYKESTGFFGAFQDVPTLGFGLKMSGGKAINRHIMLGGGIAWSYLDNYFMYSSHMPFFIEIKGDIIKKNNSLYYSFGLGYNHALKRSSSSWRTSNIMTKARGGYYLNPAIGIRFKSEDKIHFCFELNYSIQSASYTYVNDLGEITGPTKNVFFRPALAVGIFF